MYFKTLWNAPFKSQVRRNKIELFHILSHFFPVFCPILQNFENNYYSFVLGTIECCMFFRVHSPQNGEFIVHRMADDLFQKVGTLLDISQIIIEIFLFQRPQNAILSSESVVGHTFENQVQRSRFE